MIEALIILCGFALHAGMQSSNPSRRYISLFILFSSLLVFGGFLAGVEAFQFMKGFIR